MSSNESASLHERILDVLFQCEKDNEAGIELARKFVLNNKERIKLHIKANVGSLMAFSNMNNLKKARLTEFFRFGENAVEILKLINKLDDVSLSLPSPQQVKETIQSNYANLYKFSQITGINYQFIYHEIKGFHVKRNTERHMELFKILNLI